MTTCSIKLTFSGALALMLLSGCETGTGRNLDAYGPALGEEEIEQIFSGNFLLFQSGPSGTYFSTDGSINVLLPDGSINIGNWTSSDHRFCTNETNYRAEGGKTVAEEFRRYCFFIFSDGAGTYILDPLGTGSNTYLPESSIVRGFPMRNEFNALRRDLGV